MKQLTLKMGKILLGGLLIIAAIIFARLGLAGVQVAQAAVPHSWLGGREMGSTTSLAILPLYEEAAVDDSFQSGHGVSYLIRTDAATILMDLGHNPNRTNPVPLLTNMGQAGISPDAADVLFISHNHPDHVGGLRPQPASFATAGGQSVLDVETAYAPVEMGFIGLQPKVAETPQVIAPGVATLGRMPFVQPFPFWLWQPLGYEQVLAINVAGRGIVLITGCGHPTLERIVAQAEALFAEPVVGIVGGLHYEGLTAAELALHVQFLAERDPQLVALSPHDDGPAAIDAFQRAFPAAYRHIRVGEAIQFDAAAVVNTNSQ